MDSEINGLMFESCRTIYLAHSGSRAGTKSFVRVIKVVLFTPSIQPH